MKQISSDKLKNHPELSRVNLIGERLYLEIGIHVEKSLLIGTKKEVELLNSALVLAISPESKLYKENGVRKGDTVIISADIDLMPFIDQNTPNPFTDSYTFKTEEEYKEYVKDKHNGPTVCVRENKVMGIIQDNESFLKRQIANNDNKIIN